MSMKYTKIAVALGSFLTSTYIASNVMPQLSKPHQTQALETDVERTLRQMAQMAEKSWFKVDAQSEQWWDELQAILEDIHSHHQIIQAHEQNAYVAGNFLRAVNNKLLKNPTIKDDKHAQDAAKRLETADAKVRDAAKKVEKAREELKKTAEAQRLAAEKLAREIDELVATITENGQDAVHSARKVLEAHPHGATVAKNVYEANNRALANAAKKEQREATHN